MKKVFMILMAGVLCVACGRSSHEGHDHETAEAVAHDHEHEGDDHDHDGEHGHDHDGEHGHDHDGDEIKLEPERAAQLGIVTEAVEIVEIPSMLKVTGEVIADPAASAVVVSPSAGRIKYANGIASGTSVSRGRSIATVSASDIAGGDDNAAAKIRLEAAKRELDRLAPLRESGIVTAAEYNAAKEAYELALNALGSGNSNVTAPIDGVIVNFDVANGQYVAAGDPIATIAGAGDLVIRADVPKRHSGAINGLTEAKATCSHHPGESFDINLSSKPVATAADRGYQPVYFTIASNSDLHPGDLVEVYMSGATGSEGILVDNQAIVERFGRKFVYVRLDEDCYERRMIETGVESADHTEILSGLQPGDEVVIEGVTYVRLAESSNVAIEGHHHH